jgi:hypothetical protein
MRRRRKQLCDCTARSVLLLCAMILKTMRSSSCILFLVPCLVNLDEFVNLEFAQVV